MKRSIVKMKLNSRSDFIATLGEINLEFSEPYWQHDRIYVPRNYKPHANFPRLIMRTEMRSVDKPAKYYFILKRHIEDSGVDIVEETIIKDYENIVRIISCDIYQIKINFINIDFIYFLNTKYFLES